MTNQKIFLFGFKNAGKKTLIKCIESADYIEPESSLAERINKMVLKDVQFQIWDVEGNIKFQDAWNQDSGNVNVLMFVLDTSDVNRFIKAKNEFYNVLFELDTNTQPLLFCFHKMDLELAKNNYPKARDLFKLQTIGKHRVYQIQTSSKIPEDIQILRDQLVEIIESLRW